MSTEIKVWQISDNHIRAVEDTPLGAEHLESELEKWIVESPDILGQDVLIIAKQKEVQGVGRLDLLALQPTGELVIVELKGDMAARDAVTQALDYASWLDKISDAELLEIAQEHLDRPLDEAFTDAFGIKDMPAINPRNHRIVIVGSRLDAAAERIINYLAQRHSVNINAIFFRYAKLSTGQELLARSVLVPESVLQPTTVSPRKPSMQELLAAATGRQVLPMVQAFRALGKDEKYATEEAANAFGGSFRYWRKNTEGKAKMVVGVNVSGQRKDTPVGQLDIWIPTGTLAQVLGISDAQVKEMLGKLPVLEMRGADAIVRVKDERTAREAAKQFEEWFEKYPGFHENMTAATAG
jgi:Endonuclease NucS